MEQNLRKGNQMNGKQKKSYGYQTQNIRAGLTTFLARHSLHNIMKRLKKVNDCVAFKIKTSSFLFNNAKQSKIHL